MTAIPITRRDQLWSPAQRARLVRLCTAVVGDASAAEDLAQETLLTAWRLQHRLTDPCRRRRLAERHRPQRLPTLAAGARLGARPDRRPRHR